MVSEPRPSVILRYWKCVRCGWLAQMFDTLVLTKNGLAHRQCSKGAN